MFGELEKAKKLYLKLKKKQKQCIVIFLWIYLLPSFILTQ